MTEGPRVRSQGRAAGPKVLVIEDEVSQREVLAYNLKAEGYIVRSASTGEEALLLVAEETPDVIVLDWMIPVVSGLEVCRRIRATKTTCAIPIIMLSARSDELDRVRGLEVGADDYVKKPYSVVELMARIRALLRRTNPSLVGETLEFEGLTVNAETQRVYRGDVEVRLGPTEYRLLLALLERPGRVLSREQLLDAVWGTDVYIGSRTVDVHVGRLRKSLMQDDTTYPVRTVRGAGYALG